MYKLQKNNYIDDNRLIGDLFKQYVMKLYGPVRIRQKIKQKGFKNSDIEQ
ncbi:hypothetical protein CRV10_03675 (plasmid) [Candidatus Pantoea edessiphila]|uniref:Uncharacterized protein n=1 Tax=Candidatus Pantoea edessiphila TaxID=2044610 RepID=A0A2P5SV90_9GAMM|nr:hypothetical protein CRV10_03675 [Candidatus Pantoea edessiphila]